MTRGARPSPGTSPAIRTATGSGGSPPPATSLTRKSPASRTSRAVWAKYRVFEGGILQVHRRLSSSEALAWSEKCRGLFWGMYPGYGLGRLEDRCFPILPRPVRAGDEGSAAGASALSARRELHPLLGPAHQVRRRHEHRPRHDRQQDPVVDDPDELGAERDRQDLGGGEDGVGGGGDAALELERRASLQHRVGSHDDPRQARPEADRAGQDAGEVLDRHEARPDGQQDEPEAHERALADPFLDRRRGRPSEDGADTLDGDDDPEKRRRAVQALAHDGEADRLQEPDDEQRDPAGDDHLAQHDRVPDVVDAGGHLDEPVDLLRHRLGLFDVHEEKAAGGDQERRRVDDRDHPAPGDREQPCSGQRADQSQALPDRREHAPCVADQLVGEHHLQQSRLAGAEERVDESVQEGHEVDQPELFPAVDEEEQQHDRGPGDVAPQEERTPGEPVDDHAGERGQQRRDGEGEEHQPGGAVAPGQLLDPDRHGEEEGSVAEEREALTDDVAAGVAVLPELAHLRPPRLVLP